MATWRLILNDAAEGASNMALDRALLDAHQAGEAPPTVRLYRWVRPTVSLGRFQPLLDVDGAACEAYGVDICRRPTGGRGVLHDDEITYCIVAGVSDGLPRGTAASYRMLCAALCEAYRELGIDAGLTARSRGVGGAGACYLHATPADLSLGAAKLSGSAQVWNKDSCLQHGSFVMSRDVVRESSVFGLDEAARQALVESTDTIEHALGRRPDDKELMDGIVRGMQRGLGVDLVVGKVSPAEGERARVSEAAYRTSAQDVRGEGASTST